MFFVPYKRKDLEGITQYVKVQAISSRHAEYLTMMYFRPFDVHVNHLKIVKL